MDEYIYGFVNTLFYAIIFFQFVSVFSDSRKFQVVLRCFFFFISVAVLFFISVVLDSHFVVKMLAILIADSIFVFLFFGHKILKCFFMACMYQALTLLSEFVALMILMNADSNVNFDNADSTLKGFLMGMISQICVHVLIVLMKHITSRDLMRSNDIWLKFDIMPVVSLICIVGIYINWGDDLNAQHRNMILMIAMVFVFVNIYVYYLMCNLVSGKNIEIKAKILEERNNQIYEKYKELDEQYKYMRKKEHEYQNVLMSLVAVAEEHGEDAVVNIIKKELNMEDNRDYRYDTNNAVTNLIFNKMYQDAEKRNIYLSYKFNDLNRIPLSEKDTAIVYGNIIKNAIEACEKLDENRCIYVSSYCEEDQFVLTVENYFEGDIERKDGRVISSKKDKKNHGFGLGNVKEIITQCGGMYINKIEDNMYKTQIFIPICNENI